MKKSYGTGSAMARTQDVAQGGVVLLVGVGGRLGVICAGAAIDAGMRCIAVPRVEDAWRRMFRDKPRVVLVPGSLSRAELDELAHEAHRHGAQIVALPQVVAPATIAHAIALALARSESDADEGPETIRESDRSSGIRLKT